MKKLIRWLFRKKVMISWIAVGCLGDIFLTYGMFKSFPGMFLEKNPVVDFFLKNYGLELTFFGIMPIVVVLVVLVLWRFWHKRLVRWYGYVLFFAKLIPMPINIYSIVKVIQIMNNA